MGEYGTDDAALGTQIRQILLRLRQEREKARISQMDLSFLAGLSQNQVGSLETGQRTPNLLTLLKICNALNINPAVLFSPSDEERDKTKELIINLVAKL
jgi:transcriptional regulator with XRE-family HTH domain